MRTRDKLKVIEIILDALIETLIKHELIERADIQKHIDVNSQPTPRK
jgi:hypothetical protein